MAGIYIKLATYANRLLGGAKRFLKEFVLMA
jgi:hypothetical protein